MKNLSLFSFFIIGFLLLSLISASFLLTPDSENNLAKKNVERYQYLSAEIRCLVCQNSSIADSNAPLAKDLREKIQALIEKGYSDRQIKNYLVSRFGEFILFRPPLNKHTYLLWAFPLLLGICFILGLYCFFKKRNKKSISS